MGARTLTRRFGRHRRHGQHVFLGLRTEYIRFLERIDVRTPCTRKSDRVPIIDKSGERASLRRDLPPPAHLLPSLLRFARVSRG